MDMQSKLIDAKNPKAYLSREAQEKELERKAVGVREMSKSAIANEGGRRQDYWTSKEKKKEEKPPVEDENMAGMTKLTAAELKELEELVDSCKSFISAKEWVKVTENCSRQLELVPESLRAGKFMSQAQHELGKAAVLAREWDRADLLLRASLSWKSRNLPSKFHHDIASISTELAIVCHTKGKHAEAQGFEEMQLTSMITYPLRN